MGTSRNAFSSHPKRRVVLGVLAVAVAVAAVAGTIAAFARGIASSGRPASVAAYRGLGSWIDIYDTKAWKSPLTTVKSLKSHGVRTLYIQTGNSGAKRAVFSRSKQAQFIRAAHARHMKVVAWYLPTFKNVDHDYSRIKSAIRFRTSDGQRFDSFALDIESSAVHSISARNRRLAVLSTKIRRLVGKSYPLGAIIPSPVGIKKNHHYWPHFPFSSLPATYNVIVPMSYYTYHGHGAAAASRDTSMNVKIVRQQSNCATIPIHLIGGIAEKSRTSEVRAFANMSQETSCVGASLYDWSGTKRAFWTVLKVVKPR